MRVQYEFAIQSRIYLTGEPWPSISLQRESLQITVRKPAANQMPYINLNFLRAPHSWGTKPDLAKSSDTTVISLEIESSSLIPRTEIQKTLDPVALDILSDLKAWIRFLTRQYWVGYTENFRDIQHYTVSLICGNQEDQLSTAGRGHGYDYFRWLDLALWKETATRLAQNEKPRPGQLFFCDGLLHLMELNLAGAVVALATACELEVFALIEDILEVKGKELGRSADEIEWRRFTEKLDELERFCGCKFFDFDSEANQLVKKLYRLRNKAAHRARLPFEDAEKPLQANAAKLLAYVGAVEKLFAWMETQRSTLLQDPCSM